jgi:hypothetical protein
MRQPLSVFLLLVLTFPVVALSGYGVYAAKSLQTIYATPALVYSSIDGKFTDMKTLKLTPLGEQLVSQDRNWMVTNEWADALSKPQTMYEMNSLREDLAYVRLKYYERGWINNDRWLGVLIDKVADSQIAWNPGFVTDLVSVYLSPNSSLLLLSTPENRKLQRVIQNFHLSVNKCDAYGDCPDSLGYCSLSNYPNSCSFRNSTAFIPWKGIVVSNSSVGHSADFPRSNHVIYEMRIDLDALGIGDNTFGFAVDTRQTVMQNGGEIDATWPSELAKYGFTRGPCNVCYWIPSYWGVVELSTAPVIQVTTVTTTTTSIQQQPTTIVTTTTAEAQTAAQSTPVFLGAGVGGIIGLVIGLLISRLRRKK